MTDQGLGNVFIFGNKSGDGKINFPATARQVISTSAGSLVGLDVADLNGDNKPEIICNSDKSEMFILPNESSAGSIDMGAAKSISISGANLVNLKVGDLDLDGDKDIAVTNLVNNIYVLINNGSPNEYQFSTPKYIETGRAPWGLDFGDLNGDGLPDIVVTTTDESDRLTALINTSTANSLSYIPYDIGNADVSFNVVISDMNGDAKPDIGYVNRVSGNNELVFLRNTHCVLADIFPKNPAAVCSNKPVTLRATPALKVNYTWTNTGTGESVSGDFIRDISMAGSYNVTITSTIDGCESASTVVELLDGGDNLPPTVATTGPGVVCEGNAFTLSAEVIDGVNYYWSNPNNEIIQGNEITISAASIETTGRYALVLESAGCRTDPVYELVEMSAIPTMEIATSAGELFCEGTSNELSVPLINQASYVWKKNGSVISSATTNVYSSTESGTFNVNVKDRYGCTGSSNSLAIKKVTQPVAAFADIASSCLNEEIQFVNNSDYDDTETPLFRWDFGDGTTSSLKNPSHTYTVAGNYIVSLQVGYNNTTCSDIYEQSINISQFLNLEIKANGNYVPEGIFNLCEGNQAELSVTARDGDVIWNTGETTAKIVVSDAGVYTVASGGNSGCSSSDAIEVKLVENVAVETVSSSHRIESGSSVQLAANGAEFYQWVPAEFLDNANISNPLASPLETTEFTVTGSNSFGCTDSVKVIVYVDEVIAIPVDAPRAFTPNGDGQNDIWIINNIDVYESCAIRIFNRQGRNVYEAPQYNNDWDGFFNGTELPEGAYYYILTCGTSEVHTGDITLIR
jgi:gliding motility-associated-like protein